MLQLIYISPLKIKYRRQ